MVSDYVNMIHITSSESNQSSAVYKNHWLSACFPGDSLISINEPSALFFKVRPPYSQAFCLCFL